MSKKDTKVEPVIGKYYTNGCGEYVRVDGLESGVPYGAGIQYFEGFVCVAPNTSLDMFFYVFDEGECEEFGEVKEISKEEFEQELKQAQERFENFCNQIKESKK